MPVVTRSMARAAAQYNAGYAMFQGYDDHNYENENDNEDELNYTKCLYKYCYQCSLNVDKALCDYLKGNKKYQDIEKSINFPRYLRSNRKKFVTYLKYLTRIVNVNLVADKIFIEGTPQREDILCPDCHDKFTENFSRYQTQNRVKRLYKSNLVSRLYNKATCKEMLPYYIKIVNNHKKFYDVNKVKLREFNKYDNYPISHLWKGANYYHEKIFRIPCCLEDANIPIDHYSLKKNLYINDSICGHTLASHGWYQEALQNMIELYEDYELEF